MEPRTIGTIPKVSSAFQRYLGIRREFDTEYHHHRMLLQLQRSSGPARQIGVMQDSAPLTACELGAVLGRGGKEADPHGVSSILWTHLVREPRRKKMRAHKKECNGGHLERSEALARRKVSFLHRQGDTDLHACLCSKAVTDACVTELPAASLLRHDACNFRPILRRSCT